MDTTLALLTDPTAWAALLTLLVMEVVLGIDNLLFISILSNKLPEHQRDRARQVGIGLAQDFTWRELILIAGGLFLVWKATKEIRHAVDPSPTDAVFDTGRAAATFGGTIVQILLLDLVFSIDSILTAIGMTDHVAIMVVAVVIAVALMLLAANPLANFVKDNPTIVMLALGFLLMIGMVLIAEGFGAHVPKGYIYGAMAFSALVEGLNLLSRRRAAKARPLSPLTNPNRR
jgi:predicted tellurium resistance membrane protein TerC